MESWKHTARKHALEALLSVIEGGELREGLQETPDRVARMYEELFAGYEMNPKEILSKTFDAGTRPGVVKVSDIHFTSMCEHHIMPFFGEVSITYQPRDRVVGLSKLARLVECFARRLQIQERMGSQILDAIVETLQPISAIVEISAEHTCMTARGVNKPGSRTHTRVTYGPVSSLMTM